MTSTADQIFSCLPPLKGLDRSYIQEMLKFHIGSRVTVGTCGSGTVVGITIIETQNRGWVYVCLDKNKEIDGWRLEACKLLPEESLEEKQREEKQRTEDSLKSRIEDIIF